ncbi:hypothetical protein NQ315_012439 [Exocentrus adspersus]|uniref:DUF659 domain-containing protein n=1 Tax=Exocentrus adspersus TaxID=1586481 RepID=A0AAV8VNB0_9CUCU|nr:hypothetical protein NQ315_012439 [Exocentrus adspersus]
MMIKGSPELKLDGDKVFCTACAKMIACDKKFQVDQHLRTASHNAKVHKLKSGPVQQSVRMSFDNASDKTKSEKDVFNQELCRAFVAANIPLKKLQNQQLREFLQKHCNQNISDESTLRKKSLQVLYENVIQEIRTTIYKNNYYVIVDESTDACGRYIVHLIIGTLKEDGPGKPHLIASKELQKTNNVTVTRFIQQALSKFFLPNQVPAEKFLVFLSDSAAYMVKVGQNLKIFYSNMVHVTCLLHGINRVAEAIRMEYPLVNKLISSVKKVFLKVPLRVQLYKEKFPGVSLPPEPVITRWGTWIKAAIFYADHFDLIKELILEIQDNSQCVIDSQKLLNITAVAKDLVFIKTNFGFIPDIILSLENRYLSLRDSVNLVNTFSDKCKKVPGAIDFCGLVWMSERLAFSIYVITFKRFNYMCNK